MDQRTIRAAAISASLSFAMAAGLSFALPEKPAFDDDPPQRDPSLVQVERKISDIGQDGDSSASRKTSADEPQRNKRYVPLEWDADDARLALHQGSSGLWGTCGECAVASTLNMATGSDYTESDIVDYVLDASLCDASSGGMTLDDMVYTYLHYLPDDMDVFGYGGSYAPSIDAMAQMLDNGILLNVSVYGEMMREGGHTGEGEIYGTHWIVLSGATRNPDGSVEGFDIVDSASSARHISASGLSDIYYGHAGTVIQDPSCVQVYGWEYAEWGDPRSIVH